MAKFLLLTISSLAFLSANFVGKISKIEVSPSESIDFVIHGDTVKTCMECHAELLAEETVHAPAKKSCERCHETNGSEHPLENTVGFSLAEEVPALCYECHDPKNEEEHVHDPIAKGECMTCHSPHSSPNLYLAKASPVAALCNECHTLDIPEGNMVHQAVTDGDCQACHNPHQSDNEKLLNSSNTSRLCRSCHKPQRKELKKEFVHSPFKEDCFNCHQPHSSREAHLVDQTTVNLCLSCHEEIHASMESANLVHGALKDDNSCLNCHSAHASDIPKILKSDSSALCLDCHNRSYATDTRVIANIELKLRDSKSVHAAIEENGCLACHQPHTSERFSLLNNDFPENNYGSGPESFALCFDCHDKALLNEEFTTTATNFRNEDQNLHFLHSNSDKGRNCNLCHDVHGSMNEYLIRTKAQFGNWKMPLKYTLEENGGSCSSGCHSKKSYERLIIPDTLNNKE